ncbi:MAG TPA: cytochrome D1 domain-containing protein [Novimethylophilus sp.]|jgi:YVTN family beta-propeller protein|uniref:cytochrome D1 domain-containing protein n=1 Tax=Novimethylophilus sp. TaxID=2137426 RepID=UPI002F4058F0
MNQSRFNPGLHAALLFALGLTVAPAALADGKGVAYVSNQDGGVTVVDLESMETRGTLDIEAKGPRGIGITADGKLLVTANKDDGNISVLDTATGKVVRHIAIGKNPEFVRVYDDKVYVTYEPSSKSGPPPKPGSEADKNDDDKIPGRIAIVDLKQGKVVKEIVGKLETEGVEFSRDGKKMIVTNESDNSITVHDMKTGKLLKSIAVGSFGERPRGIKVAPDGKSYVATLEMSNKLLVLDDKLNPVKTIDTGKSPYGVSFDRDGKRLFVASSREKALQVFDARTFEKIGDIPTGDRCWHFSFTPDDSQILLACGKSNEVLVIDTAKLEVTKHLGDKDMPWGIVTYPKSMGSLDRP